MITRLTRRSPGAVPRGRSAGTALCLALSLLGGCDGDGSSAPAAPPPPDDGNGAGPSVRPDATPLATRPVTARDTPVEELIGVVAALDERTELFLLTEPERAGALGIVAERRFTDGDLSAAVGGTFLRFEGLDDDPARAIIRTDAPLFGIFACDEGRDRCDGIAYSAVSDTELAIDVEPGRYYLIEEMAR